MCNTRQTRLKLSILLILMLGLIHFSDISYFIPAQAQDIVGPQPALSGPLWSNLGVIDVTIDFDDSNRAIINVELDDPSKVEVVGGTVSAKLPQNSPADTVWVITINRDGGDSDITITVKADWYQDEAGNNNTGTSETFAFSVPEFNNSFFTIFVSLGLISGAISLQIIKKK